MHRFGTHRVAALRVSPPLLLRAYPGTQHDIAPPLVQAREILQSEQFRQMMFVPFHVGFSFYSKSLSRSNPGILRSMMHMASMMRSAGLDPLASLFGGSTPVVPGNSSAPPASNTTCRRPGSSLLVEPLKLRIRSVRIQARCYSFLAVYHPLRTHVLLRRDSRFSFKCAILLCAMFLG
jgi:hypothetical protein